MEIGDRRDVGDDQARYQLGSACGQRHRHLASHAVTENPAGFEAQRFDQVHDIRGHAGIIHFIGMKRIAVITQIDRKGAEMLTEPTRV